MTSGRVPALDGCLARAVAWSPLYTLIIGEREIGDFDGWPTAWRRP